MQLQGGTGRDKETEGQGDGGTVIQGTRQVRNIIMRWDATCYQLRERMLC